MPRLLMRALPWLGALAVGGALAAPAQPALSDAPASSARAVLSTTTDTTWNFTLPRAATTSAGVYDLQGRLLRTLWRAETLPAGAQRRTWDGRDDQGQAVAPAEVEFRLIHHRMAYVWEGVIGNSSTAAGGPSVHRSFLPPTSIAPVANRIHYAVGYNEGQPGIHGFALGAPQVDIRSLPSTDPFVGYAMLASDGVRMYWANTGGLSHSSFIGAHDLATSARAAFSAGAPVCLNVRPDGKTCYPDQAYASVIDLHTEAGDAPTGLAVQRRGRLLAVAHGGRNLIRLFDKTSGARVRDITVRLQPKALNQLAMSPAGDLWVISGRTVLRYTDLDGEPRLAATISALERPLALGTAEAGDDGVWVADGGASQQLKRFDREGQAAQVIGVAGGYGNDPAVASDKLFFGTTREQERTALGVATDGSVWVVDTHNNRMLRFPAGAPAGARSDEHIAYLPASYAATVDHGNPRRVFANFLEFEVDGNAPLHAGSWKLVRNWLAGLPAALTDERTGNSGFGGFASVETLANGRTYGMLSARGRQTLVELPASGPLRVVKPLAAPMPRMSAKVLYENGDLGHCLTGPGRQTVLRLPLKGFDAAGDPVWSSEPSALASVPTSAGSPWFRGAFTGLLPPRFPVSGSGRVVFLDQSVQGNEGFHLGAAAAGADDWLWQASPSGALDGKGSFQTKRLDGSITYGANAVWANGRHIVYGYHGEFYKDLKTGRVGQANQFMHFDESGLFIGQFGQPSTREAPAHDAGLSGNAFSPTLVRDGGRLYLYHNDESTHGGVHRWRIDGWDDIADLRGSGTVGSAIELR